MCINPSCNQYDEDAAISNTGGYCVTCKNNLKKASNNPLLDSAEKVLVQKYNADSFTTEIEKAQAILGLNKILKERYLECYRDKGYEKVAGDTSKFLK
jgi:hypothetical protein